MNMTLSFSHYKLVVFILKLNQFGNLYKIIFSEYFFLCDLSGKLN